MKTIPLATMMQISSRVLFLVLFSLLFAGIPSGVLSQEVSRTWTSLSGKTIDGILISANADDVIIRTSTGATVMIKFPKLMQQDQEYVRKFQQLNEVKKLPLKSRLKLTVTPSGSGKYQDERRLVIEVKNVSSSEETVELKWKVGCNTFGDYWNTEKFTLKPLERREACSRTYYSCDGLRYRVEVLIDEQVVQEASN